MHKNILAIGTVSHALAFLGSTGVLTNLESQVAALALAEVNAAPTVTSLEVRSPGFVAEHFDQGELVKRISLGLYTVNLAALGAFTNFACQALLTAPNALTASICVNSPEVFILMQTAYSSDMN